MSDERLSVAWAQLEEAEDDRVTVSVKYLSREARRTVWGIAERGMHLEFVSRIVADTRADKILELRNRSDIADIEIISWTEKTATLHRLLELWRVFHYVIAGRFDISAFNFSQGVRPAARFRGISGERTIAEALNTISQKAAPVFVAAGNAGVGGLNEYSEGSSVFPVVATQQDGRGLYADSSRPNSKTDPSRLFLFSEGAPRAHLGPFDSVPSDDAVRQHLSIGQMICPEESAVLSGGSSFATFVATSAVAHVHQYLEVVNSYLSATTGVGEVFVKPFVSYYVDNPIRPDRPELANRLADRRHVFASGYRLRVEEKRRLQRFFFGNTVEFNLRYSTPLLNSFFRSLPSCALVADFDGPQPYISKHVVLERLKRMTFADWLAIAANGRSMYYPKWLEAAEHDRDPLLDEPTIDAIADYCRNRSLFVVLSDEERAAF